MVKTSQALHHHRNPLPAVDVLNSVAGRSLDYTSSFVAVWMGRGAARLKPPFPCSCTFNEQPNKPAEGGLKSQLLQIRIAHLDARERVFRFVVLDKVVLDPGHV